ncbi:nuclear transport factor 2 family protein [Amycolatopsis anabasis]|uniref:nuclear transport factor 2 family protein n=1 Tax=Amycolatopsis anabasis TaxID=1840409 RepID=UPI00131CC8F5|nr:nuclear transport factor 2 family protein [Amycolatopsis anabasis]
MATSADDHTLEALAARVAQLEGRLAECEDRAAITEVLFRYARAADRCDLELFKSCYHPDATDCHWFFNGNAHEFAEHVVEVLARADNSQHSITNPLITLDGTRAFVESQWYVLHHVSLNDGRYLDQQIEGRYLDVFEKRDGEWKILHRQCATEAWREFVTEDYSAGIPADHPARGQRAPHDAVYRGFGLLDEEVVPFVLPDFWAPALSRHQG